MVVYTNDQLLRLTMAFAVPGLEVVDLKFQPLCDDDHHSLPLYVLYILYI